MIRRSGERTGVNGLDDAARPARLGSASPRRRGVTLLEVVLAMSILVLLSGMTFWFYSSALETSRKGKDEAYRLRLARAVLDRIATEIRQAATITVDGGAGISGSAERIQLASYRVPSRQQSRKRSTNEPPPPGEYDLIHVEYKMARHPEILHEDGYERALGLARVERSVPRPLLPSPTGAGLERPPPPLADDETAGDGDADAVEGEPPEDEISNEFSEEALFGNDEEDPKAASLGPEINWEELYAPEIRYLRFCYYDGRSWWDQWEIGGESPLPQLVMVTIGYKEQPPFGEGSKLKSAGRGEEILGPRRSYTPGEVNDDFCSCLNEDPVECLPLADDQLSTVVRVPEADPLFRSRVSRETQAMVEELAGGPEEEEPAP